jgi:uncharacterized membrane protein YccC
MSILKSVLRSWIAGLSLVGSIVLSSLRGTGNPVNLIFVPPQLHGKCGILSFTLHAASTPKGKDSSASTLLNFSAIHRSGGSVLRRLTVLEHSLRTAVVAVASFAVGRWFRLPETYWAPVTTLVITQSTLGAAFAVSWQRFVGTVLGALLGGLVASRFVANAFVFGACVLILGPLCALVRAGRSAYRFGGVTVGIVLLIPRTNPAWQIAFNRFAEVSIGIGVALLFAILWPEGEDPPAIEQVETHTHSHDVSPGGGDARESVARLP